MLIGRGASAPLFLCRTQRRRAHGLSISLEQINVFFFGFKRGRYFPTRRFPPLTPEEQATTDRFHRLYYRRLFSKATAPSEVSWLGHRVLKCPMDMITYQEIITETQPDLIIECGTKFGGSAFFLATICQLVGNGRIVTIDINAPDDPPKHNLITYLTGSSTDAAIVEQVKNIIRPDMRVMVILDSDHRAAHVRRELELYAPLVSSGCYLIVEDGNVNGHPVFPEHGPGPQEAIKDFLATDDRFELDTQRERHLLTLNPGGFLGRKGEAASA
ncbi:CmcI family methyltransferase [Afifella aestuarii]|uniref:CmcI family methyltransferase n=1 Tax=Afifella aestuarii TaxID=1909496 RepID=UPI000FE2B549|nr:CmcI family methyltransferase [Afifella aestuarii]